MDIYLFNPVTESPPIFDGLAVEAKLGALSLEIVGGAIAKPVFTVAAIFAIWALDVLIGALRPGALTLGFA